MQKLNFNFSPALIEKMDEAIKKWGFQSRAEFLRFAAIDFLRKDAELMPADTTLRDHTKAINRIKAGKDLAEMRKEWYKPKNS